MHSAFIARQPIFNRRLEAVGCELLFRGGWAGDEDAASPQRATATVVLNSLTELDLARIVGRRQAWVDVPREFVLDGLARAIPPGLSGLEIAGSECFDDELVGALRALKEQGYRLALDGLADGGGSSVPAPLELFDVVKLDVRGLDHEGLRAGLERIRATGCLTLADGIATYADRDRCVRAGCDLLQGQFFCSPAVAGTRPVSANRLALLQVVAALQRPDVELEDIEQLIARDVALSFRMLRYVNSAMIGLRGEVRSIGQALALLGLDNARRWATLSALASVDDKPSELTLTALTRGRFCELAGQEADVAAGPELFTLGLFSVLDALMDVPLREATDLLPLADDMRDALVHRRGPMGELLELVAARERGEDARATRVPHADELYLRAVIWADNAAEALFAVSPGPAVGPAVVAPVPVSGDAPPSTDAPVITARREPGMVSRFVAGIRRLFGRPAGR
jgi:EAL and modified HD-GYP domain-containing signal transduction protein